MSNSNQNLQVLLSQSNPPLRQRRQRTSFTDEAIVELEERFKLNPYPDINERESMAREFKTTEDRIQVWFQNKRARFRKRMHKENDKSQNKSEKSKSTKQVKSLTKLEDLDQSPIRGTDSITENQLKSNANSTPVSVFGSLNRSNFSFNNSPQFNNDSGYSSINGSHMEDLYKNTFNLVSYNSPLTMHPINPLAYNMQAFYYTPLNLINLQQHQQVINTTNTINTSQRTAKSVFRPFE